jgi:hypothetical protein
MHLLPAAACFAPPASSTPPSALPQATQIGGSGIAAHDVTRFALHADVAIGEVPHDSDAPCHLRVATATPQKASVMPYNVGTARTGRRLRPQSGAATSGRHQPDRPQPARADRVQPEKSGRNAVQGENRRHRPPLPPVRRRRVTSGRHQPARADGAQRKKLGRNVIQGENHEHPPPAPPTTTRRAATSGRHQPHVANSVQREKPGRNAVRREDPKRRPQPTPTTTCHATADNRHTPGLRLPVSVADDTSGLGDTQELPLRLLARGLMV